MGRTDNTRQWRATPAARRAQVIWGRLLATRSRAAYYALAAALTGTPVALGAAVTGPGHVAYTVVYAETAPPLPADAPVGDSASPAAATNTEAGAAESIVASAELIDLGAAQYASACARCHGPQAEGFQGPRLAGTTLPWERVFKVVREPEGMMASFSEAVLPDLDVQAIYAYLRSLAAAGGGMGGDPQRVPPSGG